MTHLLGLWKPKNKFEQAIKVVVWFAAGVLLLAFMVLPFLKINNRSVVTIFKWLWIGCFIANVDWLADYKKTRGEKILSPWVSFFVTLILVYLHNYWGLMSPAIVGCVGAIIFVLEIMITLAINKAVRFAEKMDTVPISSAGVKSIIITGLYLIALVLFIIGHFVASGMVLIFGSIAAIILVGSILFCVGGGLTIRKSKWLIISFCIDVISFVLLIIYLMYLIPNDNNLQTIVVSVFSSVLGGAITLSGVAWTIKDSQNKRLEEEKKKARPIFTFNMELNGLNNIEGKKVCLDVDLPNDPCAKKHEVVARIDNSNHSVFSIERIFHDHKWWETDGNKVVLPGAEVYLDFYYSKDVDKIYIETVDALGNAYYYKLDIFMTTLLPKNIVDRRDVPYTIKGIKEVKKEDIS